MIQPELRKEAFFISIFLIWPGARDDAFLSSSVAAAPSAVIGLLDAVWCCTVQSRRLVARRQQRLTRRHIQHPAPTVVSSSQAKSHCVGPETNHTNARYAA